MAAPSNITGLGVILGSTDPEALIEWYRAALEPLGARWDAHARRRAGDDHWFRPA